MVEWWGGDGIRWACVRCLATSAMWWRSPRAAISMALKDNGQVVVWGHFRDTPEGLDQVVSIAAGNSHCVALRADGTGRGPGRQLGGQTDVPRLKAVGIAARDSYD